MRTNRGRFMSRKQKIKIQSAKAKGRQLQNYVAERLGKLTGISYGKDKDIESRPMGQSGVDIILRGNAKKLIPFSIECKRQNSWNVKSFIDQAKQNELPETDWVIIAKKDRQDPVVIISLETFLGMLSLIIKKD